jgi:hypothetical protein
MNMESEIVGIHSDELKKSVANDLTVCDPEEEKGAAALIAALMEKNDEDTEGDE